MFAFKITDIKTDDMEAIKQKYNVPQNLVSCHTLDTVLVRRGETVRVRIIFRDFTGKTVYHCHILDHEDLGMMANLEIVN